MLAQGAALVNGIVLGYRRSKIPLKRTSPVMFASPWVGKALALKFVMTAFYQLMSLNLGSAVEHGLRPAGFT